METRRGFVMTTSHCHVTTAKQLGEMLDDGNRYELVKGRLRMMSPAGGEHGRIALRLGMSLGAHVDKHRLGAVYAAETGFLIEQDPDTVRAPDTAFVSAQRLATITDPAAYVPFAPDLAGEIISPNDTFSQVEEKAFAWLTAGTKMVLLVDPAAKTLHVYRAADNILVLNESQELNVDDVVPGWTLKVAELFKRP